MEVDEAADVDRSTCRLGAGPLQVWADTAEGNFFALGPGHTRVAWIVDVDGDRIVVTSAYATFRAPAALGELNPTIESISFE